MIFLYPYGNFLVYNESIDRAPLRSGVVWGPSDAAVTARNGPDPPAAVTSYLAYPITGRVELQDK
eukprot:53544-Pleurochrysis_carterae.AAC.1